jgi:FkbM family methyltransferase
MKSGSLEAEAGDLKRPMPDPGVARTLPGISKVLREIYAGESGRRQPLALTLRLLAWQLWRRLVRRPMRFTTVTGSRLRLLPGASDSLSGFWYDQVPDFEELMFALHLLRPGDLFVDVGANQGGWSLTVAGMGARVMAFEPIPVTHQRLLGNIAVNSPAIRHRIRAMPFALGESARTALFTSGLDAGNHLIGEQDGEANERVSVEVGRMDDFLDREIPVLIKIDVEGQEVAVLRGGRAVLARDSLAAVIVETFRPANFGGPALVALEGILGEFGFNPMSYDPAKRILRPLLKPFEGSQNTIYVRDADATAMRLKQAKPLRAVGTAF